MRVIIVSNRLPVAVTSDHGATRTERGFGGVALGLISYLEKLKVGDKISEYLWLGWPGSVADAKDEGKIQHELKAQKLIPVFLTAEQVENFYNGFSNDTIWPLFHSMTAFAHYNLQHWNSYKEVNEIFAKAVAQHYRPGDIIWVQDYHLMLLPKMLRERLEPEAPIGFFLHIPFPPFEIFRLLPDRWRRGILQGLLGADLVGFHIYDYTAYFANSVQRILGYDTNMQEVSIEGRQAKIEAFPMGIDFEKFSNSSLDPKVKKEIAILRPTVEKLKVILSIDRLDYTKGLLSRLKAFGQFLDSHKELHNKILLMLVVVPSRTEVLAYQEMKSQIDELVGQINGKFGTVNWSPIIYQYKSLNFEQLAALYHISDVALVTPLRDGMNLIAKEYVASRRDLSGVLILSEMAGAAAELSEAIIINPYHEEAIVDALNTALNMSLSDQKRVNEILRQRLKRYDIKHWADDFITSLVNYKNIQNQKKESRYLNSQRTAEVAKQFQAASRPLLLFDYDGTLISYASYPWLAQPTAEVLNILEKFAKRPHTTTILISGRGRATLSAWFKGVPIGLVAEHGAWIKERGKVWKKIKPLKNNWKDIILPVLNSYADRVPGAFIEEKEYSIAWHYRLANPWQAQMQINGLLAQLTSMKSNMDISVAQGHKIIEIKSAGVGKDIAAQYLLAKGHYDFILSVGDDTTDEDMFKALPERAVTLKVGLDPSQAKFEVEQPQDVRDFLSQLIK